MEGINKGSDGDKDSNDEKNSREEDTGHASEKSILKVLNEGGASQGHPSECNGFVSQGMAKGHDTCCWTRLKEVIQTARKEVKHDSLW